MRVTSSSPAVFPALTRLAGAGSCPEDTYLQPGLAAACQFPQRPDYEHRRGPRRDDPVAAVAGARLAVDPPGTAAFPQWKFVLPSLLLVAVGYTLERRRLGQR
jgi:hypothetical protein